MAVMIILKFLCRGSRSELRVIWDQNVSPSIYAMGPAAQAINSRATVVLPAPTGPESRIIDFILLKFTNFVYFLRCPFHESP
jgi:hypothetical protein